MGLIVQKYGGSSVADADKIRGVARRVVETTKAGHGVVVVVSAMGKTTDGRAGRDPDGRGAHAGPHRRDRRRQGPARAR